MSVLRRYLLLQVPGWVLTVVILYGLHRWLGLPVWVAVLLFLADVLKDFVLYPHLRKAYEPNEQPVANRLIGQWGEVRQELAPEGFVRVKGELWRARLAAGEPPAAPGTRVRVVTVAGMTLEVVAEQS